MDTPKGPKTERESDGPPNEFVDALLRNSTRNGIVRLLSEQPGMNRNQIARELHVHPNSVHFHIGRLQEVGLVETRAGSGVRETLCFTAQNVQLWENEATRMLFGRSMAGDVARGLAENPGADAQTIADQLRVSLHGVRKGLRALEESNLIRRLRVDRTVIYSPGPELQAWIESVSTARDPRLGRALEGRVGPNEGMGQALRDWRSPRDDR